MPTSSLGAVLLLDERVQNFSDLDDRDTSRLRRRFRIALVTQRSSGLELEITAAEHRFQPELQLSKRSRIDGAPGAQGAQRARA